MKMSTIPLFWDTEIRCGRELGRGAFCAVTVVKDILLSEEVPPSSRPCDNLTAEEVRAARERLANRFSATRHMKPDPNAAIYGKPVGHHHHDGPEEESPPKLALKRTRVEGLEAKEDLHRELDILVSLSSHPNIIELCGVGFDPELRDPSSLLLGQIRATLAQRLVRWRNEKGVGIYEALHLDLGHRKHQWVERVMVLNKVAHALLHMHSCRILYRDVKPENVGFDAISDIPKVFDFGCSKAIKPEEINARGLFQLTPDTGTLRYMAMEVGTQQPYGWTADVYSLGILMHEVLSLKIPFGGINASHFRDLVWTHGERLHMDSHWPPMIQELLPRMWRSDPIERPSMGEVVKCLDSMLRGSDKDLFPHNMITSHRHLHFFSSAPKPVHVTK